MGTSLYMFKVAALMEMQEIDNTGYAKHQIAAGAKCFISRVIPGTLMSSDGHQNGFTVWQYFSVMNFTNPWHIVKLRDSQFDFLFIVFTRQPRNKTHGV